MKRVPRSKILQSMPLSAKEVDGRQVMGKGLVAYGHLMPVCCLSL